MPLNEIYLRDNVVIFDLTKQINTSLKSILFSMKFVSFQIYVSNKLLNDLTIIQVKFLFWIQIQ